MNRDKLEIHLDLHSSPLSELRQDDNWWHLGTISVSKKHATFTAGYGHPINAGTNFHLDWFVVDGKSGWAVILDSGGTPPEYFVGWVKPTEELQAKGWIDTLNGAIRERLVDANSTAPSSENRGERMTFEQGNEFAPDSPWGYQRVTLATDGQLEYEQKERGAQRIVRGRVNPERVRALRTTLSLTQFPSPPETTFAPGSSVIVLSIQPGNQRMLIDYFTGLRLDGYRDLIRELSGLNDALRESKEEALAQWSFELA